MPSETEQPEEPGTAPFSDRTGKLTTSEIGRLLKQRGIDTSQLSPEERGVLQGTANKRGWQYALEHAQLLFHQVNLVS